MDIKKITQNWNSANDFICNELKEVNTNIVNITNDIVDITNDIKGKDIYVTDSEISMSKIVPEKCSKAIISKIGGKTVKSKNLIPFPYWRPSGYTTGGATFTCDDDGVITITTGADGVTGNCYFSITRETVGHIAPVVSGKTYTLRATSNVEMSNVYFDYKYFNTSTNKERDGGVHKGVNNTITFVYEPQENEVILIQVYCNVGAKPNSEVIKIQLEEGSEATEYEPYFEGLHSAPVKEIILRGVNLLKPDDIVNKTISGNVNSSFGLSGAGTTYQITLKPNTQYTIGKFRPIGNRFRVVLTPSKISGTISVAGLQPVFLQDESTHLETFTTDDTNIYCTITLDNAVCYTPGSCGEILVEGSAISEYIPYSEKEISLTEIIKNLPDYGCSAGEIYNYIDFEEMKYYHNVINVDLTNVPCRARTEDFLITLPQSSKPYYSVISDLKYTNIHNNSEHIITDMSMRIASDSVSLTIRDSSYDFTSETVLADFKEYLKNKSFIYELETPEVIDISDILTPFAVEPNGTIELVNEHNLDMPNTIIYEKEVLA